MARIGGGTLVAPELVAGFQEQGYVVVPELLSVDELDHYGALVSEAVRYRTSRDTVPLAKRRAGTSSRSSDPELAGIEPVYVEVPKGSVAFHHGLSVHLAGPNKTDTDRAVHTVIYFPDGSTRGYPYPHFAVDRAGIDVGSAIDGDVTPIAWPRALGALPQRPAVAFTVPAASRTAAPSPRTDCP
jgi:hypothetical protein